MSPLNHGGSPSRLLNQDEPVLRVKLAGRRINPSETPLAANKAGLLMFVCLCIAAATLEPLPHPRTDAAALLFVFADTKLQV